MNETEVTNNTESYSQTYIPQNDPVAETRVMIGNVYVEMKKVRTMGLISLVFSLLALVGVIAFGTFTLMGLIDHSKELRNIREDQETTLYTVSRIEQMVEDGFAGIGDGCNGDNNNGDDDDDPYAYPIWGGDEPEPIMVEKPVIYLYPENDDTDVNVNIGVMDGADTVTYPKAEAADNLYTWKVSADKDGTLRTADGREYSYLFWEAENNTAYDMNEGFCVAGEDTAEFLEAVLTEMGLTAEERDDMITYWMPRMCGNKYNIISFKGLDPEDEYNRNYPLTVTDDEGNTPDSVLRVLMVWKAADVKTEPAPQEISGFERVGFTVVEWGGTEIK